MVCTRTVRKPSQYGFEGFRKAPSSDGLSGSSHWGYNWILYQLEKSVHYLFPKMNWVIMAKSKRRIVITLECTECRTAAASENAVLDLSLYNNKNRRNNPKDSNWWNSVLISTGRLFIAKLNRRQEKIIGNTESNNKSVFNGLNRSNIYFTRKTKTSSPKIQAFVNTDSQIATNDWYWLLKHYW